MARRGAAGGPGPAYFSAPQRRAIHDPNESSVSRFLREQIFAPEHLPGNLNVATSLVVFFGGIAAIRTWGELMVPA